MANINLLPVEEKEAESFIAIQRRFLFGSIAVIIITGVITFGILGSFSILASKRAEWISAVEQSAQDINSLKSSEELMVVVGDKVSDGEKIINSRTDLNKIFGGLSDLTPRDVYFSDLKFLGGKILVSGKAKTSADTAGLVSSLVSAHGAQLFSEVTMDTLSSDEKGGYVFALSMNLAGVKSPAVDVNAKSGTNTPKGDDENILEE